PPPDPFKNMTDGCKTAIVSFFTSPDINKCLPLNNLLPLLTALSSKNTTAMFSALKQFASSTSNITKGCLEDDIKKNHNELATMALLGTTLYSPIIESLCFQISKNDSNFCFTDTLLKLFFAPAPKFPPVFGPFIDKVVFCTPTTFCTDCNHRISQEVFNFIFDPKHRDVIDTLGLFNVTEAELNQFRLSTMIKCGFEFLKSNKTFPGVCP
ncbi:33552_t:CDS:2, partial [Gigaspora margarita]